jgi:hypothetical protein
MVDVECECTWCSSAIISIREKNSVNQDPVVECGQCEPRPSSGVWPELLKLTLYNYSLLLRSIRVFMDLKNDILKASVNIDF